MPSPPPPRSRQSASISSMIMTCSAAFSWMCVGNQTTMKICDQIVFFREPSQQFFTFLRRHSSSAEAKSSRTFCSELPSRWLKTSGPATSFGLLGVRRAESLRATSVFPVPGGPWRITPRACLSPRAVFKSGESSRGVWKATIIIVRLCVYWQII